jgi:hypothetical protein
MIRQPVRWVLHLRGELIGHVFALTWPAACERAVRRWKISHEDQEELRVEKAETILPRIYRSSVVARRLNQLGS